MVCCFIAILSAWCRVWVCACVCARRDVFSQVVFTHTRGFFLCVRVFVCVCLCRAMLTNAFAHFRTHFSATALNVCVCVYACKLFTAVKSHCVRSLSLSVDATLYHPDPPTRPAHPPPRQEHGILHTFYLCVPPAVRKCTQQTSWRLLVNALRRHHGHTNVRHMAHGGRFQQQQQQQK